MFTTLLGVSHLIMNSFLVRRVLIVAGLTVPSVGVAQLSACDSMNVPAAFVDLYDPSLMRLASVNQGMTEFFGYPEWTVLDLEGNIVAEETVNFFGLIDTHARTCMPAVAMDPLCIMDP